MELGLSGDPSDKTVDLSTLARHQNLFFNNDTYQLESSGRSVDLSSMRIISLQASIDNVNGKEDDDKRFLLEENEEKQAQPLQDENNKRRRTRGVRGLKPADPKGARRLKKNKGGIRYGGNAASSWTIIESGHLVGMSVTADYKVTEGLFEVRVVECSNMDNITPLGQPADLLTLYRGGKRGQTYTFANPIPVKAGDILCFEVARSGKEVKSEQNHNPASFVLLLEQA